jgi:hypothetical protein
VRDRDIARRTAIVKNRELLFTFRESGTSVDRLDPPAPSRQNRPEEETAPVRAGVSIFRE